MGWTQGLEFGDLKSCSKVQHKSFWVGFSNNNHSNDTLIPPLHGRTTEIYLPFMFGTAKRYLSQGKFKAKVFFFSGKRYLCVRASFLSSSLFAAKPSLYSLSMQFYFPTWID